MTPSETSGRLVEVVAKYGSSVLDVQHVGRSLMQYVIGEGPRASLTTTLPGLPDPDGFALVSYDLSEGPRLHFVASMQGWVEVERRRRMLADLAAESDEPGPVHSSELPKGARCTVVHGPLTFEVRVVDAVEATVGRARLDRPFWFYNAASLLILGTLLVLLHFVPEPPLGMALDEDVLDQRYVSFIQRQIVDERDSPLPGHPDPGGEGHAAGQGHRGQTGGAGHPEVRRKSGLYAMRGPASAPRMLANHFDPEMEARHAGILGQVDTQAGHFLASPYGRAYAVGREDEDVWGHLTGTEIAPARDFGGLGLVGTGRGGGGEGEGTIGLGDVGTMGGGGGCCGGEGRGTSTGFGPRRRRVPKIRQARAKVCGCHFDEGVIRRIVRSHINEIRHCYNEALVRDPNRAGRVELTFYVGPTGKVAISDVSESTLGDPIAERCMAKAVKRWKFPRPRGTGSAKVVYPFVLSPG